MIVIFESHPVQYRAPIYQALEKLEPGRILVVYASDFSVRGYHDRAFGNNVAWDIPLLEGYAHFVLGKPKSEYSRLSGFSAKGVDKLMGDLKPEAVLLPHSFNSGFAMAAYLGALRRRIPIWIRMEVQDGATERSFVKGILRSLIYRILYLRVKRFFYIGVANKTHYLKHGVDQNKLVPAHYCARNPLATLDSEEMRLRRSRTRTQLGFHKGDLVIGFFGKLISKKDPALLLNALPHLPPEVYERTRVLYVGSGELQPELTAQANAHMRAEKQIVVFAGFVNQLALENYYLAADIVVLPSRRMGETWGVVVNEALQAGCSVVISNAVGCCEDFGHWERVRVIPVGDSVALGNAINELSKYPRDFTWAIEGMEEYSIQAAAESLAREIRAIS